MQCDKCGSTDLERDLRHFGFCHTCEFWMEKITQKDHPAVVRVNGVQYVIAPENAESLFREFGGARWHIRFFDGNECITTNLWCNGTIPEKLREQLPDNAEFI